MAIKIPQEYLSTDYDFGFSGISEADYNNQIQSTANETATQVATETAEVYKRKLADVERLMMPLLVNLLKTSDKEYIHWPNRSSQLEDKIEQLLAITRDD